MSVEDLIQSYEETVFFDRRHRSGGDLTACRRYAIDFDRLEPGRDRGKQRQPALHDRGSTV